MWGFSAVSLILRALCIRVLAILNRTLQQPYYPQSGFFTQPYSHRKLTCCLQITKNKLFRVANEVLPVGV